MFTKCYFSFYLGVSLITPQCPMECICIFVLGALVYNANRFRVGDFLRAWKSVCFLKVHHAEVEKNKPE